MKSRAMLYSAVGLLLFVAPLLAGGLKKFRDWDQSPQGYFMTKAERDQWRTIKSDDEAEKFVADFLAKRKPGFADEVANRAAAADKYLTIGKTPGSKTLRGKVIILLGPPSAMDVAVTSRESTKRDNPFVTQAMTNTGGYSAGGRGDDTAGGGDSLSTSEGLKIFHFNYAGAAAKALDRSSIDISVEADAATGKDRITDRKQAEDVDQIFEAAAQRWIKK